MRFSSRIPILAIVAFGVLLLGACGDDEVPMPVVTITAADYSFTLPETIEGGLTRLRLDNTGQEDHHVQFLRLREEVTMEQFQGFMQQEGADLTQVVAGGGGVSVVAPASQAEAIMDLQPGNYVLVCFIPSPSDGVPHFAKGMLNTLTVTAAPEDQPDRPEAAQTVSMTDFAFSPLTDLDSGVTTVEVVNNGQQIHEMAVVRLKGITTEQLLQMFAAEGGGEPPPGPPPFEFVGGLQATMPGETGWAVLDLAPGDYALVCFVEDPETGTPHAALGMTSSFTIQ
jgi:hypothetical protein